MNHGFILQAGLEVPKTILSVVAPGNEPPFPHGAGRLRSFGREASEAMTTGSGTKQRGTSGSTAHPLGQEIPPHIGGGGVRLQLAVKWSTAQP